MKLHTERKQMILWKPKKQIDSRQGSIVVEAAFVMPIVIFTVFALIYLSFYLYDICMLQGRVDLILHKAGINLKHMADLQTGEIDYEIFFEQNSIDILSNSSDRKEAQIKQILSKELNHGLMVCRLKSVNAEVGALGIKISIEAEHKISLPFFAYLFQNIIITDSVPIHDPAETIRRDEIILETASEIKGLNTLKNKLENILNSK